MHVNVIYVHIFLFLSYFIPCLTFNCDYKMNSYKNNNYKNSKINEKMFMKKEKISNLKYFPQPISENQKKYFNYLNDERNHIVVALGPAGTGKTMFACLKAIQLLKKGILNKIVITRPVVPVEEDIGFLPGNINKKMDPWTRPIFDVFTEYYSKSEMDNMIYNNIIEISPLAYMRGRTFKNSFIIADEMQNSSPNQMLMLTTRIGVGSKMVITGDLKQTDKTANNGLADFVKKINIYYDFNNLTNDNCSISLVEFNTGDVERSEIVKKVISVYDFKIPFAVAVDTLKKNVSIPISSVYTKVTTNTIATSNATNNATIPINDTTNLTNTTVSINDAINTTITKKDEKKVKSLKSKSKNKTNDLDSDAALIPIQHIPVTTKSSFRKIWED